MQAMPDARQQSFEEIYGPPENFLEIEVRLSLPSSTLRPPILEWPYLNVANLPTGQEPSNPWHITQHVHRL